MEILRKFAKKLPVISFVYRALHNRYIIYQLKRKSTEEIFTDIYKRNLWGGEESVSGQGSDSCQTGIVISELITLFNEFNISTMLDLPCGDFHWMKNVDLSNINYTGGDIVSGLIKSNREKYGRDGLRFQQLDLIKDKLPRVDLLFCRDCLVHFSYADIVLALTNICDSQSEYFLTTTFLDRNYNFDITTGQWRVLNLEIAPFMLLKPLKIINEGCTEEDGLYGDKALGLWRVVDIREKLTSIESNINV